MNLSKEISLYSLANAKSHNKMQKAYKIVKREMSQVLNHLLSDYHIYNHTVSTQ